MLDGIGPAAGHEPATPFLLDAHARLSEAGRIDAWFWGHEHNLRLYAPYQGVARGRNINYGAVPLAASAARFVPLDGLADPPTVAVDVPLDVADGAYTHGFALLDLSPESVETSYWAVTRPDWALHRELILTDQVNA